MRDHYPLIPAEAGTQFFGCQRSPSDSEMNFTGYQMAQTWVPASAGMSGRV